GRRGWDSSRRGSWSPPVGLGRGLCSQTTSPESTTPSPGLPEVGRQCSLTIFTLRALLPRLSTMAKPPVKLRSAAWFGTTDKNGFMYRSWMRNQGIPDHEFQGKPIIGICNTWSELTPCNAHFRQLAERVRRGVFEAGGYPVEFPVFSNGESNLRPPAMFTRNLASMDVEEAIRGNPI